MAGPSPHWSTISVQGTWLKLDGTPHSGKVIFTVSARITSATDDVIFPAGGSFSADLDSNGHIEIDLPVVDDPDIAPNDWQFMVEERLTGTQGVKYYIAPKSTDGEVFDLRTIVVPSNPVAAKSLVRGVPGGVAGLNSSGEVVDATGTVVGSGSGVSSWDDLEDKPSTFPPTIGTGADEAVAGNDSRLTDTRTPTDGSVTDAKVASDAAIALSKLATDPLARANHTGTQLAETISDFEEAVTAIAGDGAVSSVAGKTGAVTLDKSDVGLSNVDNTADASKPVSTDQQSAIDAGPVFITESGGEYPARSTVTSNASRRVIWIGSDAPTVGSGGAVDGVDIWWRQP